MARTKRSLAGSAAAAAKKVIGRRSKGASAEVPATAAKEPVKKASASKAPAKSAPAQKTAAPKTAAQKSAAPKSAAPKSTAKAPAKKTAAKSAPAKKSTTKTPAKKATAKSAPAKKTATKTPAKKTAAKNASAKKSTTKAPAKRAAAKTTPATTATAPVKTAAKKTPAKRTPAKKAPAKKTGEGPTLAVREEESAWTKAELADVVKELNEHAERLHAEVEDQEHELEELVRDAGDGAGHDQADMGATSFERDHELTLVNNGREMLAQIDRALARIEDGTYGVCESCGRPIGKMRLMAFPRATLCMSCKQREEERR